MKSLFCCPVCGAALDRGERAYVCPGGHSFDIAREGYVHLLPANRMHSKAPGDDKGMAAARSRFLDGGYYGHLREALCELALKYGGDGGAVLDSGCGEGYYTQGVYRALSDAGRAPALAGIDISKFCLRKAAKRVGAGEFAVASAYRLPLGDGAVGLVLNCFSPMAGEEFHRVLARGGKLLYVVPAPDHLWELKALLYKSPYPNPDQVVEYPGFRLLKVAAVERTVAVEGEALADLFQMTPYYYNTPRDGVERLEAAAGLELRANFRIHVFERT